MSAPVVPADLAAMLVAHAGAYDDHRRAVADWIAHDGLGGFDVAERERNASTRHHKVMRGLVAWTRANAASLTPEARAEWGARTLELIGDVQDKAHGCTPGPYGLVALRNEAPPLLAALDRIAAVVEDNGRPYPLGRTPRETVAEIRAILDALAKSP